MVGRPEHLVDPGRCRGTGPVAFRAPATSGPRDLDDPPQGTAWLYLFGIALVLSLLVLMVILFG